MEKPTRTISVDRLFTLGSYKNIKFGGVIDNIPYEVWSNPDAMELLSALLLLSADRDFLRYQKMNEDRKDMLLEEALAYVSDLRDETYKEIQSLLMNGEIESLEEKEDE